MAPLLRDAERIRGWGKAPTAKQFAELPSGHFGEYGRRLGH